MNCPYCGQPQNVGAKFCSNCGRVISLQQRLSVCPICGQSHLPEKVSVRYQDGVRKTEEESQAYVQNEYGITSLPVTSRSISVTEQASRLAPPPEPEIRAISSHWYYPFAFIPITAPFAPISKIRKAIIILAAIFAALLWMLGSWIRSLTPSSGTEPPSLSIIIIAVIILTLFIMSIFIFLRGLREEGIKRIKIYENEKIAWQKAIDKWNRLYYCSVTDCIFEPQTGESIITDRMREMLYK